MGDFLTSGFETNLRTDVDCIGSDIGDCFGENRVRLVCWASSARS